MRASVDSVAVVQSLKGIVTGSGMPWTSLTIDGHVAGCVVWAETQEQADARAKAVADAINRQPIVNRGDEVLVENYMKRPSVWELGTVTSLKFENGFGTFSWHYTVVLARRSATGHRIRLAVGDDGVRAV